MENETKNTIQCHLCGVYTPEELISYKSTDPEHKEPMCQDCVEGIFNGTKKIAQEDLLPGDNPLAK